MTSEPTESPLPGTPAPTVTVTAVPEPVEYTGVTSAQFNDFATVMVLAAVFVVFVLYFQAIARR